MTHSRRAAALALAVTLCLASGAVAQYDDPTDPVDPNPGGGCAPSDAKVQISGLSFVPATLTVAAGTVVCWSYQGSMPHNVRANDGSFRSGNPVTSLTYRLKFNAPGTYGYYCEVHGTPGAGMRGSVVVQGGGGGDDAPGSLQLAASSYSVGEGAANATIAVQRSGGDDGAVSVQYATSDGNATAGQDYTARSGSLSWADGDDSPKSFTVPILDDGKDEPNESFTVALSAPSGGATLGARKSATVTIQDDDGGGPGAPPPAPGNLRASGESTTEIRLRWNDVAGETGYAVEARTVGGTFQQVATAPADATGVLVAGLANATGYVFRVRAENAVGASPFSGLAAAATLAPIAPCVASGTSLCLNDGRFELRVGWKTSEDAGDGQTVPLPHAPDSGLFYFFASSNIEMLAKVLDACGLNARYWVFFAATTDVELGLLVIDTATGATRFYFNPLGRPAAPVQDTDAFATCP